MPMLKRLNWLLRHHYDAFNNDNLHRIAISNLEDGERGLERWWERKFSKPLKEFHDYTYEELVIAQIEDYYSHNPHEIKKFEMLAERQAEWDGTMPAEHEREMRKRWSKKKQFDLSQWQDEKPLTEEEEKRILADLGKRLPGSKRIVNLGSDEDVDPEFDEQFLGEG